MKVSKVCFLSLLIACLSIPIAAQIDRTNGRLRIIAGGGVAGAGLNGLALDVPLEGPTGVAFGSDGAVYVAEFQGGRVRRIDSSGRMTTITGGGHLLNGETGPALFSSIMGPASLLFDKKENLYIAEQLGNRVRRINKRGIISTIAGNGTPGPTTDGVKAVDTAVNGPNGLVFGQNGDLYVSEFLGNRVRKIDRDGIITTVAGTGKIGSSGDGGPATQARLSGPTGLAIDSKGNLYVGEIIGNRVRRIDTSGTITTVVENIIGPSALAFDRDGSLLIAEHFDERIRRLDTAGNLTTIMQTDVYGLTFDPENNIHIAQITAGRVAKLEPVIQTADVGGEAYALRYTAGVAASPVAGPKPGRGVSLKMPAGLTHDEAGNLYIAEITGGRVQRVDSQGVITTFAGTGRRGFSGDGGPAINAELDGPGTLGFDGEGNLYVVEILGNRVRQINRDGIIRTIAGTGVAGFSGDGGPAINAQFNHVHWGGVDRTTGAIYLVDTLNHRIRQIDRNGIITTVGGNGQAVSAGDGGPLARASFNRPEQLAIDNEGNWYISEGAGHRIRKVNKQGIISTVAGTGKAGYSGNGKIGTRAKLNGPTGLAIGNKGHLYIADSFNSVVRRLDPDGRIWLVFGTPGQRGLAEGSADKTLLVSPWGLSVRKKPVATDGTRFDALEEGEEEEVNLADVCPGAVVEGDGGTVTGGGTVVIAPKKKRQR
jgi:sugar lactone lactonase YvrE